MRITTLFSWILVSGILGLTSVRSATLPVRPITAPSRVDLQWWQDSRYGLFLHWGLYSVAGGEWKGKKGFSEFFQLECKVPIAEMRELAKQFNPTQFNAEEWVRVAKSAGMKYIVITTKHHEGFAMYNSPCDDYNIVKATPFGRDPIKELSDACDKYGLKFCVYYSLGRDWDDPDVPSNWPREGGRSNDWDFPNERAKNFASYFERKAMPQVKELLQQYNVHVLWFDTEGYCSPEESQRLIDTIQKYRPGCLINDRVGNDLGDFITPEQTVIGGIYRAPWESCITIGSSWGFNKGDTIYKSPEILGRLFVDIASKGGNMLLNLGPTPQGTLPAGAVKNIETLGRWLQVNGEALYGTKAWRTFGESFVPEVIQVTNNDKPDAIKDETAKGTEPDIRFTVSKDGSDLYLFARSWKAANVTVQDLLLTPREQIASVSLLGYKGKIAWESTGNGIRITRPNGFHEEVPIYVFKLHLKKQ